MCISRSEDRYGVIETNGTSGEMKCKLADGGEREPGIIDAENHQRY